MLSVQYVLIILKLLKQVGLIKILCSHFVMIISGEKLTEAEKGELNMYLEAAENFWDIVVEHNTYVTGGNSQAEHFHAADELGYDATKAEYDAALTCETCNTYNMLKLSKALFNVTKDKKYMDYFENTYINAILSSQNPETGTTMYFQPMAPGYNKV